MNSSFKKIQRIGAVAALLTASALCAGAASGADGQEADAEPSADKSLAQQIFNTMLQVPGTTPGYRAAHAKGIVCEGTFAPSKGAAALSKAAHFQGASVPVTVRFSNAAPDPFIPDNSPNVGPRGMAIRFSLPGGGETDILPVAGQHNLSEAEAKTKSANFLAEELETRLKTGPVKFRMIVQLPNAGDPTNDPSLVWPDDRKTIEMGTISITSVVADSNAAEKALVFFPTTLTDGIELSDDPLPALRTSVYALSFAHRQQQ